MVTPGGGAESRRPPAETDRVVRRGGGEVGSGGEVGRRGARAGAIREKEGSSRLGAGGNHFFRNQW
jgi:hypothetical protein